MKDVGVLKTFYSDQKLKSLQDDEQSVWLSNMGKLFEFCSGMQCLLDQDITINNHIFFSILDAFYVLGAKSQYPKYYKFVWKQFKHLLESPEFHSVAFFLQRNTLFRNAEIEQKLKISEVTKPFIKSLKIADYDGINILEYCFMYRDHKETGFHNLCKPFVYLLNAFLKATESESVSNANYVESLMTEQTSESLYYLLNGTDFLHMKDSESHTPLYYAANFGLDEVVQFYAQYVFKHASLAAISLKEANEDVIEDDNGIVDDENEAEEQKENEEESEYHWIEDQNYLHSILVALLTQTKNSPNSATFRALLATKNIDLSHYYKTNHIAYTIVEMRQVRTISFYDGEFLLECMQILDEFDYDWLNRKFRDKWNILQSATYFNDHELVVALIKLLEKRSTELLSKMLNERGVEDKTKQSVQIPFMVASYKRSFNILKTLMLCKHQQFQGSLFLRKVCAQHSVSNWSISRKWMELLYEVIEETNGSILNERFDDYTKQQLHEKLAKYHKYLKEGKTKKKVEETTSKTDKLMKFFQIDATNKDKIQQTSQKNGENEEKSNLELVTDIIFKLEANLNIMESVIETKSVSSAAVKQLKSLSLQYAACTGHFGKIYGVAYANGYIASAAQDGLIIVWKVEGVKAQKSGLFSRKKYFQRFGKSYTLRPKSSWTMGVALNKDASRVCYGGLDNTVSVCDINRSNLLEIWYPEGYMCNFKFMDCVAGEYILASSGDGKCYVFDTDLWRKEEKPYKIYTIAHSDVMKADYYKYDKDKVMIVFCSTDTKLYFAAFDNKETEMYYAIINDADNDLNTCVFSPNGKLVATAGDGGKVYIYDVDGLYKRKCIEYDPKSKEKVSSSYFNGVVLVCENDFGEFGITDVVFMSDDCLFICTDNGDTFYLKRVNGNDSNEWGLGILENKHAGRLASLAVDIPNKLLFSGSWDTTVHAHNVNVLS